jgi:hypothetical protein
MVEAVLIGLRDFRQLSGQHQDPSDYGNQRHDKEWLGDKSMFAKRDLHRVEQFDNQQNQQNLIQQFHELSAAGLSYDDVYKVIEASHQERDGADCEQQAEARVDDVLNQRQGLNHLRPHWMTSLFLIFRHLSPQ